MDEHASSVAPTMPNGTEPSPFTPRPNPFQEPRPQFSIDSAPDPQALAAATVDGLRKASLRDGIQSEGIKPLSFSTIRRQGDPVEIDGKRYHLMHPSRWGAAEADEARWHFSFIDPVATQLQRDDAERLSQQQIADYRFHLCAAAKLVLPDCPAEIVEQLGEGDQQELVQAFMRRLMERSPQISSTPAGPTTTGGTPSAASAASTPDTAGKTS